MGINTGAFKVKVSINPFFKNMLLVSYVCLSAGSIVIFYAGYLSGVTCFFSLLNIGGVLVAPYLFSTQTSKCRFECATAISEMKIPDLEAMKTNVIKQTIVHYIASIGYSFLVSSNCSWCLPKNVSQQS